MSTYDIREFADLVGVSVKTLQRWDRGKILVPDRTPTNRRIYNDSHLAKALGKRINKEEKRTIAYIRVSSQAQKPDLKNQRDTLEQFCIGSGYIVDEWVSEIGSGLNFKRKKFLKVIDKIITGRVERLIVAHKDRLSRFGFDLIKHLCDIHGCNLVVMNVEKLSPEQEMIQDMLSIVHCFSARLYGLRNYKKTLQKALADDTSTQNEDQSNS